MSSRLVLYSGLQTTWVALPTTYFACSNTDFVLGVDQFCSTGVGLLCGCPMYRTFSVSWGLHCSWGITFTSGVFAEDPNLPQSSNTQLLPVTTLWLQYHMYGCYISDSAANSRCLFGPNLYQFLHDDLKETISIVPMKHRISPHW